MKKKTSVELLVEQYQNTLGESITKVMKEEIDQAKEMHKQEIIEAHCDWNRIVDKLPSRSADEYYKNTYEKENQKANKARVDIQKHGLKRNKLLS